MREKKLVQYISEVNGDLSTPVSIFLSYVGEEMGFLLESKEEGKGRYSFIGKTRTVISYQNDGVYINRDVYDGDNIFASLEKILTGYTLDSRGKFPFEGGLVGFLGYDVVRLLEKIPDENPDEIRLPLAEFMLCKEFIVFDHYHNRIFVVVLAEEHEAIQAKLRLGEMEAELSVENSIVEPRDYHNEVIGISMDENEFEEGVERIKTYIKEGDVFQAVLSRRYKVKTEKPSFEIYRSLRKINPSPYLFYLNFMDYQIIGSSPEMLVEKNGDTVVTCPIAGTRRRGKTTLDDEALSQEMLSDPKERAEHMMLVDLGRNDMGKIARSDSIKVNRLMEVHQFSHVMHLVSYVEGLASQEKTSTEIFSAFFPAGTLSGAPKIRAMEIIDELEPVKRSFYGGSVGYFSFNGELDTCITIRALAVKDGVAYMQAGAGIVLESDPKAEYVETENKLKAVLKALE